MRNILVEKATRIGTVVAMRSCKMTEDQIETLVALEKV